MKRIAGIVTFACLAVLAYAWAHFEVHWGAAHAPVAMQGIRDDPIVSNGMDGGRPPAEHVVDD